MFVLLAVGHYQTQYTYQVDPVLPPHNVYLIQEKKAKIYQTTENQSLSFLFIENYLS